MLYYVTVSFLNYDWIIVILSMLASICVNQMAFFYICGSNTMDRFPAGTIKSQMQNTNDSELLFDATLKKIYILG